MKAVEGSGYYTSRSAKLLKDFDKTTSLMKYYVVDRYGSDLADKLYEDARQEYEGIIPQIPHIEVHKLVRLIHFSLLQHKK